MRLGLSAVCCGVVLVALPCSAQPETAASPTGVYDAFNGRWLNAVKWKAGTEYCWGNCLENIREVHGGRLRLAVRSVGRRGLDSGTAYALAGLPFPDSVSLSLTGVQAEVLVKQYGGVPCEANTEDVTHAEVFLGGGFFSVSGNGNWLDDVRASVIAWVDTTSPTTLQIGLWWGQNGTLGSWTPVAAYPVGTPLTLRLTWDRVGRRFIGSARSNDPADSGTEVSSDYGTLNVAGQAVNFEKTLAAMTNAMNCSAVQSVSHVETRFDDVFVWQEP